MSTTSMRVTTVSKRIKGRGVPMPLLTAVIVNPEQINAVTEWLESRHIQFNFEKDYTESNGNVCISLATEPAKKLVAFIHGSSKL